MRIFLLVFIVIFSSLSLYAQDKNVIYKYKKYEKFDFEDMMVEGSKGGPGDISITPIFNKEYKNRLPEKRNFNLEIRNAVNSIN